MIWSGGSSTLSLQNLNIPSGNARANPDNFPSSWTFEVVVVQISIPWPHLNGIIDVQMPLHPGHNGKNELWAPTINFHCALRCVFVHQGKIKVIKTEHRALKGYYLQWQRLQKNGIVRLSLLASIWFRGNLFKFPFPPLLYGANSALHWCRASQSHVHPRVLPWGILKSLFVYLIAWAWGQLRINFTNIFKVFTKLPKSRSDEDNLENFENTSEINP